MAMSFSNLTLRLFGSCFVILCFLAASGCSTTTSLSGLFGGDMTSSKIPVNKHLWLTSMEKAKAESKATGKPIMIWFTNSETCRYCVQLDKEVFQTEEFLRWAKQKVVPVEVDAAKEDSLPEDIVEQNQALMKRYASYVRVYPTILMVESTGHVIGQLGYREGGPAIWLKEAEKNLGVGVPNR